MWVTWPHTIPIWSPPTYLVGKTFRSYKKISACPYACFKFSDNLTELINDLKSSIIIYQKAHFIEFFFSSSSSFSSIVVIIAIFNLESIKIVEKIRIENKIENIKIENIRTEEIRIVSKKYASSVKKKNVD